MFPLKHQLLRLLLKLLLPPPLQPLMLLLLRPLKPNRQNPQKNNQCILPQQKADASRLFLSSAIRHSYNLAPV